MAVTLDHTPGTPNHVPEETYADFIEHFPTVCVEVVLAHDGGVLVAKRANEPVRGEWFWPGSRLYKGEELEDAARRVAREELGIEVELDEQLGVHAHFWDESDVVGSPSRHTVNVVFLATPVEEAPTIELDDQHTEYRWLTEADPDLHEYVRLYLEEHNLLT